MSTLAPDDRIQRLRATYERMKAEGRIGAPDPAGDAPASTTSTPTPSRQDRLRAALYRLYPERAQQDQARIDAQMGANARAAWDANPLPRTSGDMSRAVTEPGIQLGTFGDLATEAVRGTAMLPAQGMDALAATAQAAADNSRLLRPMLDPLADRLGTAADISRFGFRALTGEQALPGPDLNLGQPSQTIMGAIGSGIPQVGMATAVGAATGGLGLPAAAGAFGATSAAPVMGSTYRENLNQTGDRSSAAAEAMGAGAITGATSMVPGVAILRRVPGGSGVVGAIERHALARMGMAGGAEAAQEYVEGASQDVLAMGMRQGRLPTGEELGQILTSRDRFMDAIAGGTLGAAARGGVELSRMGQPVPRGTPVPATYAQSPDAVHMPPAPPLTPDRTDESPAGEPQQAVPATGAQPIDVVRMPPEPPTDPTGAGVAPPVAGISPGSPLPASSPPPPADGNSPAIPDSSIFQDQLSPLTDKQLRQVAARLRVRNRGTREELVQAIQTADPAKVGEAVEKATTQAVASPSVPRTVSAEPSVAAPDAAGPGSASANASPSPQSTREPWQMTRGEFGSGLDIRRNEPVALSPKVRIPINEVRQLPGYERTAEAVAARRKGIESGTLRNEPITVMPDGRGGFTIDNGNHRFQMLREDGATHIDARIKWGPDTSFQMRTNPDAGHREVIANALASGKPVPPEVLADYPDLAPQAPPQRPTDAPQTPPTDTPDGDEKAIRQRAKELVGGEPLRNLRGLLRTAGQNSQGPAWDIRDRAELLYRQQLRDAGFGASDLPAVPDSARDVTRDQAEASAQNPRMESGVSSVQSPSAQKSAESAPPPPPPPTTQSPADAISDADESQTSARNAMMDEDRAAMGLDALDGPTRRSWGRALGDAKRSKKVEQAMQIAQHVVSKPRVLTDTETAAMVIQASGIKKRHAELMGGVESITDPAEIRAVGEEALRLEQDFDVLTNALRAAGTETGRALAARKLTIDQDFKLLPTLARAKAAKGANLSPEERAKIESVVGKLEEMTKRAEAAEKKLAERRAERAVVHRAPGREPGQRRTPQQRESDISRLLAKTNELLSKGCL